MPTNESKPSTWSIALAFGIVYLVWGSTYLAIRFALETMPPFLMAGSRFIVAGSVFYGFLRVTGGQRPTFKEWTLAAATGGLMLLGGNGLVTWAEQTVPSGLTALLIATVPLWMVLLDWLFFDGTRPTVLIVGGLAVGLGGVALLIGPEQFSDKLVNPAGAMALLAACFFWSVGSLWSRKAHLPASPFVTASMQMSAAGVAMLLLGTARGEWTAVEISAISAKSMGALIYLVIFGSIVALSAYVWLLRVCSPARVSTYAYVNPIVAVILGHYLASEIVTGRTFVAAAMILLAVVLVTWPRSTGRQTKVQASQGRSTSPSGDMERLPASGDCGEVTA